MQMDSSHIFIWFTVILVFTVIKQNQVKTHNTTKILVVALTVFIIVYVATVGILTLVYGYDFKNSIAYNETMNATKDAANKTGGIMIDQYVLFIKNQTLGGSK